MTGLVLSTIAVIMLLALGIHAFVRQRTASNLLLLTVLILLGGLEVLDQLVLQYPLAIETYRQPALYIESILPAAFLMLSLFSGRTRPFESRVLLKYSLTGLLAVLPLGLLLTNGTGLSYSPDFLHDQILFLEDEGYWFYLGIMASFIVSLVNFETTLGSTYGIARNRMKFEAFGMMGLVAVLIFYYSQALLYRTIDMDLLPIRSSVFILAAGLIGYSRIFRGGGSPVAVSRHVVYRSIALLTVGIYLVVLGMIGEGMRYFGVAFGRELTIFIAFAGGILLLVVLFSEKIRRSVKVYISKHFYAENKHDYRAEWIKFTGKLSSCVTLQHVQETILNVYSETFGLRGAALYLSSRDDSRYVRVLQHFMPESPAELQVSRDLRDYFLVQERVLDLSDREYPLTEAELVMYKQGGTWLIVPLISGGKIEGLLVLREQLVPEKIIYDDYDLMKVLARQAAQAITNLRLTEEVVEMRAMAAVSRISTFVIHDLKNLTTSLSLVVDNAAEHIGNPEFQHDAINTIKNTLFKMKDLTQRLRAIPERIAIKSKIEDMDRLCRDIAADFSKAVAGSDRILYSGSPVLSFVDGEEIRKVIVNLVQNALEASGQNGIIQIEAGAENGKACIRVIDSGCGMTDDFIKTKLFKPFQTTKEKGLGIGLYQCRQIVEAHNGRIEVETELNKGTVFTICLPLHENIPVMK